MRSFIRAAIISWIALCFMAGPGTSVVSAEQLAGINWYQYDEGLEQAKKENKPALIYLYASWCVYCKKMENEVFPDRKVSELMERFVLVLVDVDSARKVVVEDGKMSERDLARRLGVSGTPAFWFRDPQGKEIAMIPGYVDRGKFASILSYVSEGAYKKMSFADFELKWQQGR